LISLVLLLPTSPTHLSSHHNNRLAHQQAGMVVVYFHRLTWVTPFQIGSLLYELPLHLSKRVSYPPATSDFACTAATVDAIVNIASNDRQKAIFSFILFQSLCERFHRSYAGMYPARYPRQYDIECSEPQLTWLGRPALASLSPCALPWLNPSENPSPELDVVEELDVSSLLESCFDFFAKAISRIKPNMIEEEDERIYKRFFAVSVYVIT
jgi:hypothetical protein